MNDFINITYMPATGDLMLTTSRQTSSLDDAVKTIGDFIKTLHGEPVKQAVKQVKQVKEETAEVVKLKVEKKPRKTRRMFTDEQEADIIKRYKAGEMPKAIAESLGCSRSKITHIISKHGAAEGRTGWHLHPKAEPKPEPWPEEPAPV